MENISFKNAQFTLKEDRSTKLILETNPAKPKTIYQQDLPVFLRIVIAAMFSGIIAINLLQTVKPGLLVLIFTVLFFAILAILTYIMRNGLAIYPKDKDYRYHTIITLDAQQHKITKTETNKRVALLQDEYLFEQVQQITLFCIDQSPMPEDQWTSMVTFSFADQSQMVVNSGPYSAMNFTANKLAALLNITVEKKLIASVSDFPI